MNDFEDSEQAVWADGERSPLAHSDAGDMVVCLAARWGTSVQDAMAKISDVQEEFGISESSSDATRVRAFLQRMRAGMAWLISYAGDMKMAARALAYCLGFFDVAGCSKGTIVEVARACSTSKHNVKKQTVAKCIKSLETYLNGMPQFQKLPPLPGQRSDLARENMSRAARENWNGENHLNDTNSTN